MVHNSARQRVATELVRPRSWGLNSLILMKVILWTKLSHSRPLCTKQHADPTQSYRQATVSLGAWRPHQHWESCGAQHVEEREAAAGLLRAVGLEVSWSKDQGWGGQSAGLGCQFSRGVPCCLPRAKKLPGPALRSGFLEVFQSCEFLAPSRS